MVFRLVVRRRMWSLYLSLRYTNVALLFCLNDYRTRNMLVFVLFQGATVLLYCDRNREEVFYRERLLLNGDEEEHFVINQEAKIKTVNPK